MKSSPRKQVKSRRKAVAGDEAKSSPGLSPIVGIGASAGGLEAFSELLRSLPEKTGMAFVLVQHLDPRHGSALQEILAYEGFSLKRVREESRWCGWATHGRMRNSLGNG